MGGKYVTSSIENLSVVLMLLLNRKQRQVSYTYFLSDILSKGRVCV